MGYDQKTNNIHDTANSIIYHVMRLLFAATVAAIQKLCLIVFCLWSNNWCTFYVILYNLFQLQAFLQEALPNLFPNYICIYIYIFFLEIMMHVYILIFIILRTN